MLQTSLHSVNSKQSALDFSYSANLKLYALDFSPLCKLKAICSRISSSAVPRVSAINFLNAFYFLTWLATKSLEFRTFSAFWLCLLSAKSEISVPDLSRLVEKKKYKVFFLILQMLQKRFYVKHKLLPYAILHKVLKNNQSPDLSGEFNTLCYNSTLIF